MMEEKGVGAIDRLNKSLSDYSVACENKDGQGYIKDAFDKVMASMREQQKIALREHQSRQEQIASAIEATKQKYPKAYARKTPVVIKRNKVPPPEGKQKAQMETINEEALEDQNEGEDDDFEEYQKELMSGIKSRDTITQSTDHDTNQIVS